MNNRYIEIDALFLHTSTSLHNNKPFELYVKVQSHAQKPQWHYRAMHKSHTGTTETPCVLTSADPSMAYSNMLNGNEVTYYDIQ